ncbi:MAG: insulinase family protein [Planctomycetes bacterium]|nr:insulinase family protein [Planctomycetota bacterium]
MIDGFDYHKLSNGMVLVGEPLDGVETVAFDFMVPAGSVTLPQGCCGASCVISDWIFRGAGPHDSRSLSEALDGLGLHRMGAAGKTFITLGAALEAGHLAEALSLYSEIIMTPHLDETQFESARQLVVDEVLGLDDDPRQKVMISLREQFFPKPWGLSTLGHLPDLESLAASRTRDLVTQRFDPCRSIFTVAGKYDFSAVCDQIESLFGAAVPTAPIEVVEGTRGDTYTHIPNDGAQVHIGLMTETVTCSDPDYYTARMAVSVLSGGMSSRLFTEVREKRGLCYAIGARYYGLKDHAAILCYAGTTPDKAQETVDVTMDQFNQLKNGLTPEELDRAKVGLKSALIMQSESSSSRAGAIGSDFHKLGRIRSLDEIKAGIDAVTLDSLRTFLDQRGAWGFTAATMGPQSITL